MDIEDLSSRVLVGISLSIQDGRPNLRHSELGDLTAISERHIRRLLRRLQAKGLVKYKRHNYFCEYYLTPDGQEEAQQLSEYFRLS